MSDESYKTADSVFLIDRNFLAPRQKLLAATKNYCFNFETKLEFRSALRFKVNLRHYGSAVQMSDAIIQKYLKQGLEQRREFRGKF